MKSTKYLPMLAGTGTQDDLERKDLIFEPKLDGYRALVYFDKELHIFSSDQHDITVQFPELEAIGSAITAKSCVLDGELVCYDAEGNPNFDLIQGRSQLGSRMIISIRAQASPATFVVFDILEYNGKSMLDTPLLERKKLLAKIIGISDRIVAIPYSQDGKKIWKEIKKRDAEGVVAKVADSLYYPGKRKDVWLQIKHFEAVDCVVIGFTQEKRLVSSLALGLYDSKGELIHIGFVDNGLTQSLQKELYKKLYALHEHVITGEKNTLTDVKWVKPVVVVEVKYLEFTKDKKLREPIFLRIRTDKPAEECLLPRKK